MKKQNRKTGGKVKSEAVTTDLIDSDDEQGFSKWLRTTDGLELMKLFVLGNTFVVFLFMAWPQLKEAFYNAYYVYKDFFP